jgi:hypothetical protein
MTSLIVVHAEREEVLEKSITKEIKNTITKGNPIYILQSMIYITKPSNYLSSFSSDDNVFFIPSYITEVNRILPESEMIKYKGREYKGKKNFHPQFLNLKKRLLEDGISKVNLSGVARHLCIKNIYELLSSENLSDKDYDDYTKSAAYLGIDNEEFKKIYEMPIKCNILENLCID